MKNSGHTAEFVSLANHVISSYAHVTLFHIRLNADTDPGLLFRQQGLLRGCIESIFDNGSLDEAGNISGLLSFRRAAGAKGREQYSFLLVSFLHPTGLPSFGTVRTKMQ